jgi:hypothetical protein
LLAGDAARWTRENGHFRVTFTKVVEREKEAAPQTAA